MKISIGWGSHLPVLIKAIMQTTGSVLELGGGLYSTPVLHWLCFPNKRMLVTYENNKGYYRMISKYNCDFHKVIFVDDWDSIEIKKKWDVVLVDHAPAERRIEEIKKLAFLAKYIIVHDTEIRVRRYYNYESIYSLFKYKYKYRQVKPHTSVLSNFIRVDRFMEKI